LDSRIGETPPPSAFCIVLSSTAFLMSPVLLVR
jgi:hypothetical protein